MQDHCLAETDLFDLEGNDRGWRLAHSAFGRSNIAQHSWKWARSGRWPLDVQTAARRDKPAFQLLAFGVRFARFVTAANSTSGGKPSFAASAQQTLVIQQSSHSEPSSISSEIQFRTVGAVKLMATTIPAPINPPLPDPEVTPAFVRLSNRGRDGRAPQPV